MTTHRRFRLKAIAAATLGALAVSPVLAADGDKQDQPQTVEKVIVTAQKREQAAIDVPASVTSVNAEPLTRSGFTRLEDFAAEVPGMSITSVTRGYTSVVIRGISTGISQATPSTAQYIDEAPIGSVNAYAVGSTITPDLDPYDLSRIEILKGPQGTLYGANAVGGLLRYVTIAPNMKSFGGAISVGANKVSDGGTGSAERVSVNVPTGDNSAIRVSAFNRIDAGYIDNPYLNAKDVNRAKTTGGRAAWAWNIDNEWTLNAWAMTQRFSSSGLGVQDVNAPDMTPVNGDLTHGSYMPENQHVSFDVVNATLKGDFANLHIVSSTTYQQSEAADTLDQSHIIGTLFGLPPPLGLGIPGVAASLTQIVNTKRFSEELRARSTAFQDRLDYEGGVFYTNENSSNRLPPGYPFLIANGATLPLPFPIADALIDSKYQEYSIFGNATYALTSDWDLQGGLRFSHDQQHYTQDYKKAVLTATPIFIEQEQDDSQATYLASVRWKPNADTAIYGRIATGYRPGGPSALPPGVVPGGKTSFDPDTLTSYELGYKAALADGLVSIEAALFTTDWKDIQIQTSATTAAGTFQYFVNGGTARSDGGEVTVFLFPVKGLTLRGTGSYVNSRLTEDAPAAGGLSGDRMPFVPKWNGSLSADYHWPVGGGLQAWLGGSLAYVGDRVSNFSNKKPYNVPSYHTFALSGGIESGHWRLSVWGKNLSNERGVNFLNVEGLAIPGLNPYGNPYYQGVIAPRTIGTDLSYRF